MAVMKEILLSKEFVMIILFVLLYILAKTTKERDKASMESARNIIIYKEGYAYRVEEYLEQIHQYFGKVSRLLWIMAIGEWTYTAMPNRVEQGTNRENPVIITELFCNHYRIFPVTGKNNNAYRITLLVPCPTLFGIAV